MTHIRRFDHVGITVADLDRAIDFFVDLDLEGAVALAAERGYGLVGGIGVDEDQWRMAYVRGPEGSFEWTLPTGTQVTTDLQTPRPAPPPWRRRLTAHSSTTW